ncbi:MAG: hypothetical protein JWP97_1029 [Labilithrix sp.]|nr:hypothetical protein [Labilithrix sp.]
MLLRTRLVMSLFGTLALVTTAACNRVRVEEVRGPDGSDAWVRISCRHMDQKCYRAAAQVCPSGYYFANAASPGAPAGRHVQAVEVADEEDAPRAGGPAPKAGVNVQTLPPQERWGGDMYSRRRGAILVRCAAPREGTAAND